MAFFEKYVSNTVAGSGNQTYFVSEDPTKIRTSRTCYKVFAGGTHTYAFLFSNVLDSTFADGTFSRCNQRLGAWTIHEARVGITDFCAAEGMRPPHTEYVLTFGGQKEKRVEPGAFFETDGIQLSPKTGEYLCLEITFSGSEIPCHTESILPSFLWDGASWVPSTQHPFAAMVGCDRPVAARIGFWGDSITQGIGTENNAYTHWNSVVAERVGRRYAYWNLGLGYGRAHDAQTAGAWFYKAKQNDIVAVSFGVNDILNGFSAKEIKEALYTILENLTEAGVTGILQTVPPFDYTEAQAEIFHEVNRYIKEELSKKAAFVFDAAALLGESGAPHMAKYGGHPNAEGCRIWGEKFSEELKNFLAKRHI